MGEAKEEVNMKHVTAANETANIKVGEHVTLPAWRPAEVGSGMEHAGYVTGILREKGGLVRCPGCDSVWQEITMGPNN